MPLRRWSFLPYYWNASSEALVGGAPWFIKKGFGLSASSRLSCYTVHRIKGFPREKMHQTFVLYILAITLRNFINFLLILREWFALIMQSLYSNLTINLTINTRHLALPLESYESMEWLLRYCNLTKKMHDTESSAVPKRNQTSSLVNGGLFYLCHE